jgi:hypothetical protein
MPLVVIMKLRLKYSLGLSSSFGRMLCELRTGCM